MSAYSLDRAAVASSLVEAKSLEPCSDQTPTPCYFATQPASGTSVTSLPPDLAIVAVDAANVRSGPSITSSVVDQVKYGTELRIVGQSDDWFKVKLPEQREGWLAEGWIVAATR